MNKFKENSKINYNKERAWFIYLVLSALFICALITCNLIANKFVTVNLGFKTFQVSAGILPYPLTFLITDILSEIYGKRKTRAVVLAGFFASVLALLFLKLGHAFPAIENSPVSDESYNNVFNNSARIIGASMLAYLVAQLIDVNVFHWWKKITRGKHLWIRNNFSTILSQLADTVLVTTVIFIGVQSAGFITSLVLDGWLFKVIFAAADTILIYPIVGWMKHSFGLKENEELDFVA